MKIKPGLVIAIGFFILLLTGTTNATTLFYEDYESGLTSWTGKSGGGHNGQIISDPFIPTNSVLKFTALNMGGDIFTINTFSSLTGNFILSFDYLGLDSGPGLDGNLGGFIGYGYSSGGASVWLGGTGGSYPDLLPDTNQWEHVVISFSDFNSINLTLEDWSGSAGIPGDAYFDNILLTDETGPSSLPVPEPSTVILFCGSIAGLIIFRKHLT